MDEAKKQEVLNSLSKAESLIIEIEESLKIKLVVFICHRPITQQVAYRLNKIIRKCPKEHEKLALLIDSGGGDIDAAAKIVKMLKTYCKKYAVIIPFFAKSAATLLAVSADEIIMCRSGELGPVDPQVRDPITKLFVPASSIKEAIDFIEETKDPFVKLSMAEKMPPLLMGAYKGAQKISRQYIEEVFEKLGDKKDDAVHAFTDRYISHGYPINGKICKGLNLPLTSPDEKIEDKIYELYEIYIDILSDCEKKEKDKEKSGEHLVIQTKEGKCIIINGEEETSFENPKKEEKPTKNK